MSKNGIWRQLCLRAVLDQKKIGFGIITIVCCLLLYYVRIDLVVVVNLVFWMRYRLLQLRITLWRI